MVINHFPCTTRSNLSSYFWILNPWEVIWTAHACLKIQCLAGNLLWCQFTGIWHPTCWWWWWFDSTLLLPWIEVLNLWWLTWILNPLNYLCHCNKVDVIMIGKDFINPVKESFEEFWIVLQVCSVIIETQWCTILFIMSLEIVV